MLELQSLSRRFGPVVALDGVSLTVRPGVLTGFIGANGAGKTTTMRIVVGVLAPDAGEVRWGGAPVGPDERRRFGYMPEERGLYPKMTVLDQLVFFARLHGVSPAGAQRRGRELLEELGLGARAGDQLQKLSLGNQQRAQVAAALVHDPDLLLLDEPFSGLDPVAVDALAALLRRRAAAGVPVLFSSHQLDLVERLCDDVVIVHRGRVQAAGHAADLREQRAGARFALRLGGDAGWLRDEPGLRVLDVDGPQALVELPDGAGDQRLLATALRHGPVHEFRRALPTLAEIFRETVS
ncbi:MAG TPA: ATP-binding cassette domain-containing protein [Kineosporiaceae bacterium]|jgi:ABC-2 type transport system ATP-binding protein|nr:ATP-binding cassette domain-containing protein [Kineosporiaceae bacterium]